MSMHLEFEPHSWYRGAAIKHNKDLHRLDITGYRWDAFYLNGMTGYIIEFNSMTLTDLKRQIKEYIDRQNARDRENRRMLGE